MSRTPWSRKNSAKYRAAMTLARKIHHAQNRTHTSVTLTEIRGWSAYSLYLWLEAWDYAYDPMTQAWDCKDIDWTQPQRPHDGQHHYATSAGVR